MNTTEVDRLLRLSVALLLSVAVACGDDDGGTGDADGGLPIDASAMDSGSDPVDASMTDDGGSSDGFMEDGGPEDPWPTTPTELPAPPAPVPANVGEVQVVETDGGDAIAVFRATTAGYQSYVSAYDADASTWEAPRLLPGRDPRVAASGASALLVYLPCSANGCNNPGDDIFAELYTESGGWESPTQVDDVASDSPYAAMVDTRISYPFVAGDGAGGFLVACNYQGSSLSLFRELTGGVWQTALGRSGGVTQPGYHFVGHAPRRYVGIHNQDAGKTESIVDGVLTAGAAPSTSFGDIVSAVNGDRVTFAGHRGLLMEAAWNGSSYDWSEEPTVSVRQQDQVMITTDGTHEIWPTRLTTGSSGYRLYTEAFVRHDTSGDSSGTYDWSVVSLRDRTSEDFHSVPCGVLALDEGALVFLWEADATERNTQPWELLAIRVSFDDTDGIVVSDTTVLGTMTANENTARNLPVAAIREGTAIRIAWLDPTLGLRAIGATDTPASAGAGITADPATSAAAEGSFGSAPTAATFGAPVLAFGEFSTTAAEVALVDASGGDASAVMSGAPASWQVGGSRVLLGGTDDATLVLKQEFLERSVVSALSYDGSWTTAHVGPGVVGGSFQTSATGPSGVAYLTTRDAGGSSLPESLRLSHRTTDGTWSERDVTGAGDWIRSPHLFAVGDGFVATWQERDGTVGVVRASIHTGTGDWSAPVTLASDAAVQLSSGRPSFGASSDGETVVAYWFGDADLQAAVLSDLGTGFGAPTAVRTTTTDDVVRLGAVTGAAGTTLVFREENGSAETTFRARSYAGGSWGSVESPFGTLTDAPDWFALTALESGSALAYADDGGVHVALWNGSSWSGAEPLTGTDFDAYSVSLLASEAGVRVLGVRNATESSLVHALHDGSDWSSATSLTMPADRSADLEGNGESAAIDAAGDVALISAGEEGDETLELWILRDGALERHSLGAGSGGLAAVAPNGHFLVAFERQDGYDYTTLVVEAGY